VHSPCRAIGPGIPPRGGPDGGATSPSMGSPLWATRVTQSASAILSAASMSSIASSGRQARIPGATSMRLLSSLAHFPASSYGLLPTRPEFRSGRLHLFRVAAVCAVVTQRDHDREWAPCVAETILHHDTRTYLGFSTPRPPSRSTNASRPRRRRRSPLRRFPFVGQCTPRPWPGCMASGTFAIATRSRLTVMCRLCGP